MPRLSRLQYEDAIYHVVTRGDDQRRLCHDEGHYKRFTEGLAEQVDRRGWQVIAYCWMPNHIHALIRTPQPNLARGIQHWLSGYANWYAKRNRRTGHLYQGRYKAYPVEDEGYDWNLSRYVHLNPCSGAKPLADSPERYLHSSNTGYARKTRRVDWVDYDKHHRYWAPCNAGDPESAYRQFVKAGIGASKESVVFGENPSDQLLAQDVDKRQSWRNEKPGDSLPKSEVAAGGGVGTRRHEKTLPGLTVLAGSDRGGLQKFETWEGFTARSIVLRRQF